MGLPDAGEARAGLTETTRPIGLEPSAPRRCGRRAAARDGGVPDLLAHPRVIDAIAHLARGAWVD